MSRSSEKKEVLMSCVKNSHKKVVSAILRAIFASQSSDGIFVERNKLREAEMMELL